MDSCVCVLESHVITAIFDLLWKFGNFSWTAAISTCSFQFPTAEAVLLFTTSTQAVLICYPCLRRLDLKSTYPIIQDRIPSFFHFVNIKIFSAMKSTRSAQVRSQLQWSGKVKRLLAWFANLLKENAARFIPTPGMLLAVSSLRLKPPEHTWCCFHHFHCSWL